jgi:ribosomal protein S19
LRKYLGKRISIYNGKENKEFLIREAMLGAYLGEFILTKKLGKEIHIKSNKRKK